MKALQNGYRSSNIDLDCIRHNKRELRDGDNRSSDIRCIQALMRGNFTRSVRFISTDRRLHKYIQQTCLFKGHYNVSEVTPAAHAVDTEDLDCC